MMEECPPEIEREKIDNGDMGGELRIWPPPIMVNTRLGKLEFSHF